MMFGNANVIGSAISRVGCQGSRSLVTRGMNPKLGRPAAATVSSMRVKRALPVQVQMVIPAAPAPRERTASSRVFNFSAGPAAMPEEVMFRAQREFTNFEDTGMGFLEQSHRDVGGPFQRVLAQAEERLRDLLAIPDNYKVLFLQGGAHAQFAAVPLNLFHPEMGHTHAEYVDTGVWAKKAIDEGAKMLGGERVKIINEKGEDSLSAMPGLSGLDLSSPPSSIAFTHITANETMEGLEYLDDKLAGQLKAAGRDVVIDMTSTLLSRPVDVSNYALIYASGGKNLGPAGVCVAIVRDDVIRESHPSLPCPSVVSYALQSATTPLPSLYNTPSTFLVYMVNLVMGHYQERYGTLYDIETRAISRSSRVWGIVDRSNGFYTSPVIPADRSRMSVCLKIRGGDKKMEKLFVKEAEQAGMFQLQGNAIAGGLRITLYNGVHDAAVDAVCEFMEAFAARYSGEASP